MAISLIYALYCLPYVCCRHGLCPLLSLYTWVSPQQLLNQTIAFKSLNCIRFYLIRLLPISLPSANVLIRSSDIAPPSSKVECYHVTDAVALAVGAVHDKDGILHATDHVAKCQYGRGLQGVCLLLAWPAVGCRLARWLHGSLAGLARPITFKHIHTCQIDFPISWQHRVSAGVSAHWSSAGSTLGQRLRRCPSIEPDVWKLTVRRVWSSIILSHFSPDASGQSTAGQSWARVATYRSKDKIIIYQQMKWMGFWATFVHV